MVKYYFHKVHNKKMIVPLKIFFQLSIILTLSKKQRRISMKNYLTRQLQQVKTKSQMFLLSLSLSLTGSTVYADDPFAKSDNLAKQGITKVQLVSVALFGLAAVVTSLIYAFGGRELKASMKKNWISIAIAIIGVSAGPSIIEWIFDFVKN